MESLAKILEGHKTVIHLSTTPTTSSASREKEREGSGTLKKWEEKSQDTIIRITELFEETSLTNEQKIKLYDLAWSMLKTQIEREPNQKSTTATYLWESFINILRILILSLE